MTGPFDIENYASFGKKNCATPGKASWNGLNGEYSKQSQGVDIRSAVFLRRKTTQIKGPKRYG